VKFSGQTQVPRSGLGTHLRQNRQPPPSALLAD
jgi:hypothetical protein